MRMIVKFNVRDWPKRGGFMRADVVVNAKDQDEAVALAEIEAADRWPTGKWKWFDCVVDREALHAEQEAAKHSQPAPRVPLGKGRAA